jgi:hypothetical protein
MMNDVVTLGGGTCIRCGALLEMKNVTDDEVEARIARLREIGEICVACERGETPFEDLVEYQVVQWMGLHSLADESLTSDAFGWTVKEPADASYALLTLPGGRTAKIYRDGESGRSLINEVNAVLERLFPPAQKSDS